jgi:cytochrome c
MILLANGFKKKVFTKTVMVLFLFLIAIDANCKKKMPEEQHDMLQAADIKNGKDIALMCVACHSFKRGEPHRIGPNLFGIYGSQIARFKNYTYSNALLKFKSKKWTLKNLDNWIKDPSFFAPGNRMSFNGLIDPQDRMDVIAYLKTFQ